jgi:hypothetical protein
MTRACDSLTSGSIANYGLPCGSLRQASIAAFKMLSALTNLTGGGMRLMNNGPRDQAPGARWTQRRRDTVLLAGAVLKEALEGAPIGASSPCACEHERAIRHSLQSYYERVPPFYPISSITAAAPLM